MPPPPTARYHPLANHSRNERTNTHARSIAPSTSDTHKERTGTSLSNSTTRPALIAGQGTHLTGTRVHDSRVHGYTTHGYTTAVVAPQAALDYSGLKVLHATTAWTT